MDLDLHNERIGLYNPKNEHDACGIGAIVNIKGIKSHKLVKDSLTILHNLVHRGGAEFGSGDGSGVLIQIPHKFFKSKALNFTLPDEGDYALAQIFVSPNDNAKKRGLDIILDVLKEDNFEFLGMREVPVNANCIGQVARNAMPFIFQIFVKRPKGVAKGLEFERKLYVLRRKIEKRGSDVPKFYIPSFSSRIIVYKGMLVSTQVSDFYLDFQDLNLQSAICLVHSRFSTNTFPSWERAQPNRFMVHNGEINTINGNVDAMMARQGTCNSKFIKDLDSVFPIIAKPSSDSAMFDNTLEFLLMNGRTLEEAFMMMIPEPWSKDRTMDITKRSFYEYNSTFMEPWDGPASIIFSDGVILGASLDRNGFRPSRYYITDDDFLILSSETGAVNVDESIIKEKKRLEPGKLLLVDTIKGRVISDEELKMQYSHAKPYKKWIKNLIDLDSFKVNDEFIEKHLESEEISTLQKAFGYTYDELTLSIEEMSKSGKEVLASMGVDTPIALLNPRPQPLFFYFKQLFAQVTNPPLDAIREKIVTSCRNYLGKEGNLLEPDENNAKRIRISRPILNNKELFKVRSLESKGFKSSTISILFHENEMYRDVCGEVNIMDEILKRIFKEADKAISSGSEIIILSDKGLDKDHLYIPSLLAVSALHHHLVRTSKRTKVSIIIESAEPREIHHFATLLGYGATAINPYLVYDCINELIKEKHIKLSYEIAVKNFIDASVSGIIKIASKMGISTLQSYCGAQIFEALGISSQLIEEHFSGTQTNIEGITLKEILQDVKKLHSFAFKNPRHSELISAGLHNYRSGGNGENKEEHLYDPLVIYKLQNSCRTGNYNEFKEYSELLESKMVNIRDCMELDYSESISINEVESVDSIMKRFRTGAMSYGSISKEAHECLAIAMNRIGGSSNTGEGGEDESRFSMRPNGDSANSAIKQVASGRFGVSINYLVNAKEIQIKIAQGAKPGEGGQLPGNKVYPWIAKARHSTPGVSLISPPPHHDIYSIEDLAQLIFDLKNANQDSLISVKLVSESGIGTVAAGVAKAGADVILVSGYDGGTGASPRTSIPNAGTPWELGLAEVNQTLILNGLRERIRIETDGKLMTGRDLAIASLLGAEYFGFSTAPLVVIGCTMMRVCNLNTCPFGIATQNKELRKRFNGKPEYVINFMKFIAQNLREYMSLLGFRTLDSMIGRSDKLRLKSKLRGKSSKISLDRILYNPKTMNRTATHFKSQKVLDLNQSKDIKVILPQARKSIISNRETNMTLEVSNITGRTLGTILSSEVTKIHGANGLRDNMINITTVGNGGNSFGAFLNHGITLKVIGDVNDYLGKGLSGGRIIIKKSPNAKFNANSNIIAGNVCLYGAISGEVYMDGIAGERFCVRNSGVTAITLGVGQHGCEYMTGGVVVILGEIGRNFAAGMSGGMAFIYGKENVKNVNIELVDIKELSDEDSNELKTLIKKHALYTESSFSMKILNEFNKKEFFKVMPRDYELMLKTIEKFKLESNPALSAFLEITNN